MYWVAGGAVTLDEGATSGQLYVFERTLGDWVDYDRFNMWGSSETYFWGRGLSFSAVPENGTGTLPAGDYTAHFWCQFLDKDGNPVQLKDFASERDKGPAEESLGGGVDKDTLLYIPISFENRSGAAGSQGEMGVKAGDSEEYTDKASVAPEDTYTYQLKYVATQAQTTDVVLWCNVEDYNRGGRQSEWQGTVTGVKTSDPDAKIYFRTDTFDVGTYLGTASKDLLEDSGWTLASADTDWSQVKAIAVSFEGRIFDANDSENNSAAVQIEMRAPAEDGVDKKVDQLEYRTYNEYMFSDVHITQNNTKEQGRVLVDPTEVTLTVQYPLGYLLPSTGGAGAEILYTAGIALFLAAGCLMYEIQRRSRKTGKGGTA